MLTGCPSPAIPSQTPNVLVPRILTATIIGFWVLMTGILFRSIWFPEDSGLTQVDPGAVCQLIAARGEGSALDVYDDRVRVGNLSIEAAPVTKGGETLTRLKLSGLIRLGSGVLSDTNLNLNGWLELNPLGNLQSYRLTLITNKPAFELTMGQVSPHVAPALLVKQGRTVLMDSTLPSKGTGEGNPLMGLILGTLGLSGSEFKQIQAEAEAAAAAVKIEARQGKFDLAGTTRQGFVLRIGAPGKPGYRICVENTGEIVRLETPVSYHLLTEALRSDIAPPHDPHP